MACRIINNCSCIFIAFVILAIMANESNCNAVRHLLQTTPSGNETVTGNITAADAGALTGALDVANNTLKGAGNMTVADAWNSTAVLDVGNNTLKGAKNITVLNVCTLTGLVDRSGGNVSINATLNCTLNGVRGFTGSLSLSNGTLKGSVQGNSTLSDFTFTGTTSGNGTSKNLDFTLNGVATISRTVYVPLSGPGILTIPNVSPDGTFVLGRLTAILIAIIFA